MKQILVAVALVMVGLMPGVSQAATIFFDDFNNETLSLNHVFADKWTVTNGTVDLIGAPGFFDLQPGNGRYVDLDGTTNDAGIMRSDVLALLAGTEYTLTFDLAGSQRGDGNTLTYGIDFDNDNVLDVTPLDITLGSVVPFSTYTLIFTPLADTAVARIQFGQAGGDNVGLLLDNVKVTVPEPASLMLLGAGLAAIGIWRRKAGKIG